MRIEVLLQLEFTFTIVSSTRSRTGITEGIAIWRGAPMPVTQLSLTPANCRRGFPPHTGHGMPHSFPFLRYTPHWVKLRSIYLSTYLIQLTLRNSLMHPLRSPGA